MRKHLLAYVFVLLTFGIGIVAVLKLGSHLQPDEPLRDQRTERGTLATESEKAVAASNDPARSLYENLRHPLSVLLLQVIAIITTARVIGFLFQKIGQPAVIGEMLAGILLGPSLLGLLSPATEAFFFPPTSLDTLKLLSQIGVILFMFGVGIELNLQSLRQRAHTAVLVSHASILVPFFLGTAFSLLLYRSLEASHIPFVAFALFMGIAMSVTAFPVLARIIEERGLTTSYLGTTAIACAAVDDVTAWCILAAVIAAVKAQGAGGAVLTILLTLSFIGVMLFLIKPRAGRILKIQAGNQTPSKTLMVGVLAFVFASALFTEVIGIHALFGAFLAGVIMPRDANLRTLLKDQLEAVSSVFLLPLFFAFTGLRTQIGLLDDWQSWLTCAGIITVAIAGKLGGSMLAARWTGMSWHDAAAIGALMNTRGLMELIVLNIGYDLGILSPRIFAMMVLMALATTFMAGPLLSLFAYWKRRAALRAVPIKPS